MYFATLSKNILILQGFFVFKNAGSCQMLQKQTQKHAIYHASIPNIDKKQKDCSRSSQM